MKKVKILFSILLSFYFSLVTAQSSSDSLSIRYFNDQNPAQVMAFDTSMSNLYLYRPNSSFQQFSYNLGNIGLAFVPLTFSYNRSAENIYRAYSPYMVSCDSVKYFQTKRPYTEFSYTQGLVTEHFPGGLHTQQLNKNLGLSMVYSVISSNGTYQYQKTRGSSFSVGLNFSSNSGRFLSFLSLVYNEYQANENGGLSLTTDTSMFQKGISKNNRQLYATNLTGSTNKMEHKGVSWKNYWYLFGKNDSITSKNSWHTGLFNESQITGSYAVFKTNAADTLSSFFKSYAGNGKLKDSVHLNKFDNFFGFVVGNKSDRILPQLKLGWRQQFFSDYAAMNSGFAEVDVTRSIDSTAQFRLNAQYGFIGRRAGDLKLQSNALKYFRAGDVLGLDISYFNHQVSYFDQNFTVNEHQWSNLFAKSTTYAAAIKYTYAKWNLSFDAGYQGVQGYVYFDANVNPFQSSTFIHTYYSSVYKTYQNQWLRARTYARYQNSSSYLIQMPELLARQEIAFLINHKAIHAEVGFCITYMSSFVSSAYDPSLRDYYLQNAFSVGNYPFMDFYAAMRVGPTRIFVKVDHVNAGLTGYHYEMSPYYPMTDLSFKLGIRWGFWN